MRTAEKGCPHGSKLSPTLWKILFDDLAKLETNNIKITTYADDITLVITDRTYKGLKQKTNVFLEKKNR